MNKKEIVFKLLKQKPSTISEICDMVWPGITYTYVKTMLRKMTNNGELMVTDTRIVNGKEIFVYALVKDDAPNDKKKYRSKRNICMHQKRKAPMLLEREGISKATRSKIVLQYNPLFNMYSKDFKNALR